MKRQGKRAASRRGFTLIELLVVIGIMLLIMSVLFPAYNLAQRAARRNAAMSDMQNIKTAIVAYHREYGRYPRQTSADDPSYTGDAYRNLIDILRGNNPNGNNPRNIQFLEVSKSAYDATERVMVDPWGQRYHVSVDASKNAVNVWSDGDTDPRHTEKLTTE